MIDGKQLAFTPRSDRKPQKVFPMGLAKMIGSFEMKSVRVVTLIFMLFLLGVFLSFAFVWVKIPRSAQVVQEALGSDRVLLSADGREIQTLRTDFNKRRLGWCPLSSFPRSLLQALLTSEDRHFYGHFGLDPLGFARATAANVRARFHSGPHALQGASTISMQLSDLIEDGVLTHDQAITKGSFRHKMRQILGAIAIETKWTKAEILEAYINLIHLRGEFQGVPAASWAYLKKDPSALNADESSVIAALISSPNRPSASLEKRACLIKIKAFGGGCEGLGPVVANFTNRIPSMPAVTAHAPHLAARIFSAHPDQALLTSTIDADLQKDVQAILEKNIARLKDDNVRDTAAIVIENKTGRVVAYIGAVSTSENPHVDGVISYRQAGSSLKPFLYGRAIDSKTLTAASILLDEPTAISWGNDVYRPTNYDKHFYGPVSAREALSSSLNVPAVKVVTIIGLHTAYQTLENLHFTHLKEPDFYGVSMALGAVEVRLDELANAYRTYANGGQWSPLRFTNLDATGTPERLYSPEAAYIIGSILSDPNSRAIGFGWESPLETPFWTAVKTGTSKDYRDNWCAGFSDKYTVAVWAGNFNAEAMRKVSGVTGVGPSWYEIMMRLHERARSQAPAAPPGIIERTIRHSWESQEHREYFISGTEPAKSLIETAPDKRAQFVFPADGSVLVRDPHLAAEHVALFVRYTGSVPPESHVFFDKKDLGVAYSPFKIDKFGIGKHELVLRLANRPEAIAQVHFAVKGSDE